MFLKFFIYTYPADILKSVRNTGLHFTPALQGFIEYMSIFITDNSLKKI
jgi:hypothetical protein